MQLERGAAPGGDPLLDLSLTGFIFKSQTYPTLTWEQHPQNKQGEPDHTSPFNLGQELGFKDAPGPETFWNLPTEEETLLGQVNQNLPHDLPQVHPTGHFLISICGRGIGWWEEETQCWWMIPANRCWWMVRGWGVEGTPSSECFRMRCRAREKQCLRQHDVEKPGFGAFWPGARSQLRHILIVWPERVLSHHPRNREQNTDPTGLLGGKHLVYSRD